MILLSLGQDRHDDTNFEALIFDIDLESLFDVDLPIIGIKSLPSNLPLLNGPHYITYVAYSDVPLVLVWPMNITSMELHILRREFYINHNIYIFK